MNGGLCVSRVVFLLAFCLQSSLSDGSRGRETCGGGGGGGNSMM